MRNYRDGVSRLDDFWLRFCLGWGKVGKVVLGKSGVKTGGDSGGKITTQVAKVD